MSGTQQELREETPDGTSYLPLIRNQHAYLRSLRDSRRDPSPQLLDDIAVYEFILRHDNPTKAADSYMESMSKERDRTGEWGIPKMRIATKLGWEVKRGGHGE